MKNAKTPFVIGLSGRKVSGKDTLTDFLRDVYQYECFTKVYHFADSVKEFCVDYLGLDAKLCWGSDGDKNTLTYLKWGQMPHYYKLRAELSYEVDAWDWFDKMYFNTFMTVREVLQQVGTEWFRGIDEFFWVKRLFKKINEDNAQIAIIADTRFPCEVKAVKDSGGVNVRLTRNAKGNEKHLVQCKNFTGEVLLGGDSHSSETSLDPDKFDWNLFDIVIDNQNQSLLESQIELLDEIKEFSANLRGV